MEDFFGIYEKKEELSTVFVDKSSFFVHNFLVFVNNRGKTLDNLWFVLTKLFYCNGFCQVSRFIHIVSF